MTSERCLAYTSVESTKAPAKLILLTYQDLFFQHPSESSVSFDESPLLAEVTKVNKRFHADEVYRQECEAIVQRHGYIHWGDVMVDTVYFVFPEAMYSEDNAQRLYSMLKSLHDDYIGTDNGWHQLSRLSVHVIHPALDKLLSDYLSRQEPNGYHAIELVFHLDADLMVNRCHLVNSDNQIQLVELDYSLEHIPVVENGIAHFNALYYVYYATYRSICEQCGETPISLKDSKRISDSKEFHAVRNYVVNCDKEGQLSMFYGISSLVTEHLAKFYKLTAKQLPGVEVKLFDNMQVFDIGGTRWPRFKERALLKYLADRTH